MSEPRDKGNWAEPTESLEVGEVAGGVNRIQGRQLTGPLQGFGKLWQKTYRVEIGDTPPEEVIQVWKSEYGTFWPDSAKFYGPITGIAPGEVGLINARQGPVRLSTGVMVLYSDDVSFAYMTPQGHPFAGWITFSADDDDGSTHAQVRLLIRANDPVFELGFAFGGSRSEDKMWASTLRALAARFDSKADPTTDIVCVDRKRQWSKVGNIRWNSAMRSLGDTVTGPFKRG